MNSYDVPFLKLSTNFVIPWDPEAMTESFAETIGKDKSPFSNSEGTPHWQTYNIGISFARNFYINFNKECSDIASQLIELQHTLRKDTTTPESKLNDIFLKLKINPRNVNLIRIQSGINVLPHYDSTRNYAINIGLKNSNSCKTYITTDSSTDAYWDKHQYSYITSDGDVYLVAVKNAHTVKTLVEKHSKSNRYLITYNILNPFL
jgi:hypothetical protein